MQPSVAGEVLPVLASEHVPVQGPQQPVIRDAGDLAVLRYYRKFATRKHYTENVQDRIRDCKSVDEVESLLRFLGSSPEFAAASSGTRRKWDRAATSKMASLFMQHSRQLVELAQHAG